MFPAPETSENVPPERLRKQLRLIKLIEGMREGKRFSAIASTCGVSEKTIDRDFHEWKENGGFDKWLVTEFMILHDDETQKQEASQAYRVIADLLKKRLKEQVEVEGTHKVIIQCHVNKPSITSPFTPSNGKSQATPTDSESPLAEDDSAKPS